MLSLQLFFLVSNNHIFSGVIKQLFFYLNNYHFVRGPLFSGQKSRVNFQKTLISQETSYLVLLLVALAMLGSWCGSHMIWCCLTSTWVILLEILNLVISKRCDSWHFAAFSCLLCWLNSEFVFKMLAWWHFAPFSHSCCLVCGLEVKVLSAKTATTTWTLIK